MKPFFSSLFHARFRKPPAVPLSVTDEQKEKGARAKQYSRFPKTKLPYVPKDALLQQALFSRVSADHFHTHSSLSLDRFGSVFYTALAEREDGKRPYPSGGNLYPIETYIISHTIEGLRQGVYHYQPHTHEIEFLFEDNASLTTYTFPYEDRLVDAAHCMVVLTACWQKGAPKYGESAYQLALLEAGHVMQNILLAAEVYEVGARPIAGFDDTSVAKSLNLEEYVESVVYAALLGSKHRT